MEVIEDEFGLIPGESKPVQRFTLTNTANGFSVQVIAYGAAITTLKVPNRSGIVEDIVLGFDELNGYLGVGQENPYFGAAIGRSSNRVKDGKFTLDGVDYHLTPNDGPNHLHGGAKGFDKRLWQASVNGGRVAFTYISADGEEGYPGQVMAQVIYEISADNELVISYEALCDRPTPVALTNHSYFNLAGQNHADNKLAGHSVMINADRYTPVDETRAITGEILSVEGTKFDLQESKKISEILQADPEGIDHNFCLVKDQYFSLAAVVTEETSGRKMEVYTDQPGVQFYTGNFLPETEPMIGKGNAEYFKNGAFCMETQMWPDAVNNDHFPSIILRPTGGIYSHRSVYKFSTE